MTAFHMSARHGGPFQQPSLKIDNLMDEYNQEYIKVVSNC